MVKTDHLAIHLKNVQNLRELSMKCRNLTTLQKEMTEKLDLVSTGKRKSVSIGKKNLESLVQVLEDYDNLLSGVEYVVGNTKEIGEMQQEFVYDLANAATIAQLIEEARKYSSDFWDRALTDEIARPALEEAIEKLPSKEKRELTGLFLKALDK